MELSDIGVYGLGVMGRNLALNIEQQGYRVSVYNRTEADEQHITDNFINGVGSGKNFLGTQKVSEFVTSLKSPRVILMMVPAGKPVDAVIDQLLDSLKKGDIIVDGGNSHFPDTNRREKFLREKGIHFIGMGVSGGEEGARFGPSLMPGGSPKAWEVIKPIFQSIAAKADDGTPCCQWMGSGGAGHFVKMVHNGIEYADMQLIAEAYHVMKLGLNMPASEISNVFRILNQGRLNSYLTEITADIFEVADSDGSPLIDKIKDAAKQKGTGRWTVITALELGIPLPVIAEAVFARNLSSLITLRAELKESGKYNALPFTKNSAEFLSHLEQAYYASRWMALAEGLYMIQQGSEQNNWTINLADVAQTWKAGCIIRSALLEDIEKVFTKHPGTTHLLQNQDISNRLQKAHPGWRRVVAEACRNAIPVPAMSAALAEYDGLKSGWLPANLIQAQRDYFGAHTYERIDAPEGKTFHTEWNQKQK